MGCGWVRRWGLGVGGGGRWMEMRIEEMVIGTRAVSTEDRLATPTPCNRRSPRGRGSGRVPVRTSSKGGCGCAVRVVDGGVVVVSAIDRLGLGKAAQKLVLLPLFASASFPLRSTSRSVPCHLVCIRRHSHTAWISLCDRKWPTGHCSGAPADHPLTHAELLRICLPPSASEDPPFRHDTVPEANNGMQATGRAMRLLSGRCEPLLQVPVRPSGISRCPQGRSIATCARAGILSFAVRSRNPLARASHSSLPRLATGCAPGLRSSRLASLQLATGRGTLHGGRCRASSACQWRCHPLENSLSSN